jgi:hypothetical protein
VRQDRLGGLVGRVADPGELATLRERMSWPGEHTLDRLRDLAVAWVLANPDPIPLPPPTYGF